MLSIAPETLLLCQHSVLLCHAPSRSVSLMQTSARLSVIERDLARQSESVFGSETEHDGECVPLSMRVLLICSCLFSSVFYLVVLKSTASLSSSTFGLIV